MITVELAITSVMFVQRINGAAGAEVSDPFDVGGKPQIALNPEFSTDTDTAVIAVHFYDTNDIALRSKEYTITNSGSQEGAIEAGWYKGDACYIDTYGFPKMAIELVSLTGGAIDIWTAKKNN